LAAERPQKQALAKAPSQGYSSAFSHLAIKPSFAMAVKPAGYVRQEDQDIFFILGGF
jgi:hypothetical protein